MSDLYHADYCLWLQRQIQLLQAGDHARLDIDNLSAEILQLAAHERRTLQAHVKKLLYRFLQLKLYPERLSGQWQSKLFTHRHRIQRSLAQMPSLAPLVDEYLAQAYAAAADQLTSKAKLPRASLPPHLPYTKEQLLNQEFMPWTIISTPSTTPTP